MRARREERRRLGEIAERGAARHRLRGARVDRDPEAGLAPHAEPDRVAIVVDLEARRAVRAREDAPARELVAAGFALELEDARELHRPLVLSHIAHLLELRDAGVVSPSDFERLRGALVQLALSDASDLPYLPEAGDAFDVQETWLIERLGPGAEWLTAGRARREALRVAYRLVLRERLLDAADATADVIAALGDRARAALGPVPQPASAR